MRKNTKYPLNTEEYDSSIDKNKYVYAVISNVVVVY